MSRDDHLWSIAEQYSMNQDTVEMYEILEQGMNLGVNVVLEIGTHHGWSIRAWQAAFIPNKIVGVEIETFSELNRNIYELNRAYNCAQLVTGDSTKAETVDSVREALQGELANFVFIDGGHLKDVVINDFVKYRQFMKPGAMVVFHDTNDRNLGYVQVDRAIKQIIEQEDPFESTMTYQSSKNSPGIFIGWLAS